MVTLPLGNGLLLHKHPSQLPLMGADHPNPNRALQITAGLDRNELKLVCVQRALELEPSLPCSLVIVGAMAAGGAGRYFEELIKVVRVDVAAPPALLSQPKRHQPRPRQGEHTCSEQCLSVEAVTFLRSWNTGGPGWNLHARLWFSFSLNLSPHACRSRAQPSVSAQRRRKFSWRSVLR